MTPGPDGREFTAYLPAGPGGMPLVLPLSEGLGPRRAAEARTLACLANSMFVWRAKNRPRWTTLFIFAEACCGCKLQMLCVSLALFGCKTCLIARTVVAAAEWWPRAAFAFEMPAKAGLTLLSWFSTWAGRKCL